MIRWLPGIGSSGSLVNIARSWSYGRGVRSGSTWCYGPGPSVTFEANSGKGTLVEPARFHSGFANPSVSLYGFS